MSKTRDTGFLGNVVKVDASGNVSFVSGSTTLATINTSGQLSGSSPVLSASYASNAELLDGLDSTVFTLTSSFNAQTASFTAFSSSINSFSASILSYTASQNITNGTFTTTASFNAQTASFTAFTSSINAFSASVLTFTGSAATRLGALESYTSSLNDKTSSFATTGSNAFIGTQTITGSVLQSGSFTSTGTLTAQTLVVQTITSSVDFVTGSTRFGSLLNNTHAFTGSVGITGSLNGTSATFTLDGNALTLSRATPSLGGLIVFKDQVGTSKARIGIENNANDFIIQDGSNNTRLTILNSTGAATFSNTVTVQNPSTWATVEIKGAGSTQGGQIDFYGSTTRYAVIAGEYESSTNGTLKLRTLKSGTLADALILASTGAATFSSDVLLSATKKLYLAGTSYIQEVTDGMIRLAPAGNDSFDITSTYLNIWVPTTIYGTITSNNTDYTGRYTTPALTLTGGAPGGGGQVYNIGNNGMVGMLVVSIGTQNVAAIFILNATAQPVLVSQSTSETRFSITSGSLNTANVFISGSNLVLNNNIQATRTFYTTFIGKTS